MRKFFFVSLLFSAFAWAEPASLLKDTDLYAKPLSDAEVIKPLKAGEKLDITARKGAWANVKAGNGASGWLRILNLRTGSGQQGEAGVGAVASLFRTGSSGNTVSTGIKGMSEEMLRNARPNAEENRRLDKFKQTEGVARTYAGLEKLGEQQVSYLPNNAGESK